MNIVELLKKGINNINTICAKYINEDNEIEYLPIFYIAGSQTLPPPLEPKEEEELIKKLAEKDNLQTKQILVERNLRLVVYIAKKFENTGIGIEDLISIGTIGLMKGVNTFNSDKNIKLATYASRCIENEILMYLRKNNKIKGEVSIDEPLNKDCDGNELLLSDILGTDPDITSRNLEDEVDKKLLRASILKLNDREKNIMEMRFGFKTGKEKTQKEVADELRNFTKLYIEIRKKNNKQNEKRDNEQDRIEKYTMNLFWKYYQKVFLKEVFYLFNKVEICGVNTSKLPLLSNEEKKELLKKIKNGDEEARNRFVQGNLRLVLSVIQRFYGRGENADDLFQVGCVGLIKAIDNFDINQDVQFSTYRSTDDNWRNKKIFKRQ